MENNTLLSNEYYSLSELFSTSSRKIIIPDFQRDYCWGDSSHGEKNNSDIVAGFLDTLIEESNNEGHLFLGKIDIYEFPKNHIYLTDGQQRLTTLYLIIGMVFRKEHNQKLKDKLKRCLISNFEDSHEDVELYLQYSIRESTIFFLKDLVTNFFLNESKFNVSKIKNQPWYFSEYDLDPSITSILSAISTIESKLKDINISTFSNFLVNKIKIQYYDVQDKKHGEERFVILNTTGKSLTISENIKPILLGNIYNSKFAEEWEERETWFWKNKNENEKIADNGVNDFLKWCFQIIHKQDDIDILRESKLILKKNLNESFLEKVGGIFNSLKLLIEHLDDDKFQSQLMFINDNNIVSDVLILRDLSNDKQQNILLPLLCFMMKFDYDQESTYQFLRRLRKNYFDLKWVDRKNNYLDWRYILQIIEKKDTVIEILQFESNETTINKIQNIPIHNWFNKEEQLKTNLKKSNKLEIEKWEDHSDFMGDLTSLFEVTENNNEIMELTDFYKVYIKINPDDFSVSMNIKLGNIYRLLIYLNNGNFEHRTVGGCGYCMLINSKKRLFIYKDFYSIWKMFKTLNDFEMMYFLEGNLKKFFKISVLKNHDSEIDFEQMINDIRTIGHYERVRLWAILEYLNVDVKISYKSSIAQYWEYPNLIKIEEENLKSERNDYSIGNLFVGTSKHNNKSGDLNYSNYPWMKQLYSKRKVFANDEIKKLTVTYKHQLTQLLLD